MGDASVKVLSSVCGLFFFVSVYANKKENSGLCHLQREMWLKWNCPLNFSFSCLLPCCNQKWLEGLMREQAVSCLVSSAFVVALENIQSSFQHVRLSSLYLRSLIRVESLARYREVKEFNRVKEGVASIWLI